MIYRSTSRLHSHRRFSTVTPAGPRRIFSAFGRASRDEEWQRNCWTYQRTYQVSSRQTRAIRLHLRALKPVIRNLLNGVISHPIATVGLSFRLHPARLRSSSSSQLVIQQTRLSTVGDRAFPVAGSRLCNSLPPDVTSASTLTVFRNRLKTHILFRSLRS